MCSAIAQPTVKITNPKREIRFLGLGWGENEPYCKTNIEITRLIMEKVRAGEIKPFLVDYSKGFSATEITRLDYRKRLIYISSNDISQERQRLEPTSFSCLGLDQTVGIADGKEYAQVHYVNFYIYDSQNERMLDEPYPYIFSVRWEDFIKVLDNRPDILYVINSYGLWWRGNVLLTNDIYRPSKFCRDLVQLANYAGLGTEILKEEKENRCKPPSLKYYDADLFIIDQPNKGYFDSPKPIMEIKNSDTSYKGDLVSFSWEDFLKIAQDSGWHKSSQVYTLAEAFRLGKFSYSKEQMLYAYNDRVISKEGKFGTGSIDSLCKNEIVPSFTSTLR